MPVITNPYRHAAGGGPTFGNASRDFDGVNDDINMGDVLDQGTQSFTVCAWVRPASFGNVNPILAKQKNSNPYIGLNFCLLNSAINLTQSWGSPNAYTNVTSTAQLTPNVWTHVAGVLNGGDPNDWRLYINGALVSNTIDGTALTGSSSDNSYNLTIGHRALGDRFHGNIADVRFYLGSVLTPSQILDIYNGSHIASGLSGWWLTDTDDVLDYSGNGNDGTNNGSTYLPSGPFGVTPALPTFGNASRDFESTESDSVIIGTGPSDLLTDAYTMTAWVKPESFPGSYQTVFGSHSGQTYQLLYVKGNGKLALYHTGGSSINYDGTGSETLVTGQWQHVAMTVSSDDGLRGYVNGIEDNAVSGGTITTPSAIWRIGRDANGIYWDGLLSSVRLYNRVLSAEEIETLASNGDVTSGLVGHWLTDEFNYTDVIVDYSGNGNNGTNNGSTYSVNGPFDTFTPTDIAGCVSWLDSSDSSTLYDSTTDGSLVADDGRIARWEDKSGNSNHVIQSTVSSRPYRRVAEINSLDVIDFGDASTYLNFTTRVAGAATETIFAVIYYSDAKSGYQGILTTTSSMMLARNPTNWGTYPGTSSNTLLSTGNKYVLCMREDIGSQAGTYFTNGVADGSYNNSVIQNVGVGGGLASQAYGGYIMEIIVYDSALSDSDREAVETYLGAKWGVTIAH